jgi:isopentenyl-diphosphate Delta-isomerase
MSDRKKDHIDLAFKSQLEAVSSDKRFYYEPLLNAHPIDLDMGLDFLGKKMKVPIWVSSMTGGTQLAHMINKNLARACREFGMGMGLGSCRILLDQPSYFQQFDVRDALGNDLPLYANLGIAQVEKMIEQKTTGKITELVYKLRADGLFVHINPLQEYFQPEGDLFKRPPAETIEELLQLIQIPIVVKEVGQGMGPTSLEKLLEMDIAGIEFGAFGGTNFANVELMRSEPDQQEVFGPLAKIGHSAPEMLGFINKAHTSKYSKKYMIISGGIKSFLDGYYLIKKSKFPSVYGQASAFLKYAKEDYALLQKYVSYQVKGLQLAYNFLKIRDVFE